MDFQTIVDSMAAMTCIVSVENLGDGKYGKIKIVTGNRAYIDSIENPAPGTEMLTDKFTPNTEYTDYLTRDLNFEAYCYGAAVEKKCLHSYAHPDRMPVWFNMTFLPLYPDDGNICYCTYTMEINFQPNSENMSDISGEMASKVLQATIKLRGADDFEKTMNDVVGDVMDICDAEHCVILLMDDYTRTCSVLSESFAEGTSVRPMETHMDEHFYDLADSWKDTIAGSNCLIIKNDDDMQVVKERNPAWYKALTDAGLKSLVLFPLKSGNTLLGYMWASNFNADNAVKIKETLELTTFILGSELGNHLLLDRLKILSSKDMLTGVMNRNEMNNFVTALSNGEVGTDKSIGVIFADLNGLKLVNDTEGHPAGDKLLKDAAAVLRRIFDEESIFRAGGDEFAIIISGLSDAEMEDDIAKLKEYSKEYDRLVFAAGGCVEINSTDVRTALRLADERMYADKKKYYEKYPERKRTLSKDDWNINQS
ncbi:MAG: GGDEF domain-containing protein [Lachnospiraceae bacterium]|nr:GGDEF domain-containing protein [Lachnospiraceae bacterium]